MEKGKQPPCDTLADSRLLCELGPEEHTSPWSWVMKISSETWLGNECQSSCQHNRILFLLDRLKGTPEGWAALCQLQQGDPGMTGTHDTSCPSRKTSFSLHNQYED